MSESFLLLCHAGVTLIMVGIIWSVQLAIYPQFRAVPSEDFTRYVSNHASRIVLLLAPFAPAEVILALLVFVLRPDGVSAVATFVAGGLLAAGWVATGLWYAPLHGRLQTEGYDARLIERLIATNWLRTALWSTRGVLALALLA